MTPVRRAPIWAAGALALAACMPRGPWGSPGASGWGAGSFESNGERIYFTASSDRGTAITYTGGPPYGGMMMGGPLACVSCHGPDGRGGPHTMHMWVMDAPDIRWATLAGEAEHADEASGDHGHGDADGEYDLETFRLAVVEGQHPDGEALSQNMPRWNLSDGDLTDLKGYLQSLP